MWRAPVQQWLVVMAAIGVTTVLVMFAFPRQRRRIPLLVPLVLGVTCAAVALVGLAGSGASAASVLMGTPLADRIGWPAWLGAVTGLMAGLGGAAAAFGAEQALLRSRRPAAAAIPALPLGGSTVDLPGRAESMAGVARVASAPGLFLAVSAISATGEELLFRGSMLAAPPWHSVGSVALLVGLQAVLFAGTHVAFGWRTVLAKVLLGLALGLGALLGGLVVGALVPHLAYQARVLAQFRPVRTWLPNHA